MHENKLIPLGIAFIFTLFFEPLKIIDNASHPYLFGILIMFFSYLISLYIIQKNEKQKHSN